MPKLSVPDYNSVNNINNSSNSQSKTENNYHYSIVVNPKTGTTREAQTYSNEIMNIIKSKGGRVNF